MAHVMEAERDASDDDNFRHTIDALLFLMHTHQPPDEDD